MAETSKFKKHFPNSLSLFRLVISLAGFLVGYFTAPDRDYLRWWFVGLFIFSVFIDIMDGFLARRWKVCSEFGSRLDSIGDASCIIIVLVYVFFQLRLFTGIPGYHDGLGRGNIITAGIMAVSLLGVKISAAFITRIKHGRFNALHTYGIKIAAGFLMAAALLFIILLKVYMWVLWVVAAIGLLAFLEEIAIVLYDKVYNIDRKGFLFDKKTPKKE